MLTVTLRYYCQGTVPTLTKVLSTAHCRARGRNGFPLVNEDGRVYQQQEVRYVQTASRLKLLTKPHIVPVSGRWSSYCCWALSEPCSQESEGRVAPARIGWLSLNDNLQHDTSPRTSMTQSVGFALK